jgi:hypothetical protein
MFISCIMSIFRALSNPSNNTTHFTNKLSSKALVAKEIQMVIIKVQQDYFCTK